MCPECSPDMVVVESLQAFCDWSGPKVPRQRDAMLKIESCRIGGLWDADQSVLYYSYTALMESLYRIVPC